MRVQHFVDVWCGWGTAVAMQHFESFRYGAGRVGACDCKYMAFVPSSCGASVCLRLQPGGCTPLNAASENGHVEVVRALVGAGAAVNEADVRDHWLVVGARACVGVRC
jgi:hypothetical protein